MPATPPETPLEHCEARFALVLGPELRRRSVHYVELLRRWGNRINLAGPAVLSDPYPHLFEAYWACRQDLVTEDSLVDVGSGAGLPGLALALYRPQLRVTLLEPNYKKALFLSEAGRLLGLEVGVEQIPFEAFQGWRSCQLASLRGLRPTRRLLQLLRHHELPWLWFRGGDQDLTLPGFRLQRQLQIPASKTRWVTRWEPEKNVVSRETSAPGFT